VDEIVWNQRGLSPLRRFSDSLLAVEKIFVGGIKDTEE
jgi:hypothetical protein